MTRPPIPLRSALFFSVLACCLCVFVTGANGQVFSDPNVFVWTPTGGTATPVVNQSEVGMDFQTNGTGGVYLRVVNDSPVDATTGADVILNFRSTVQIPWLSIGIQDESGQWHYHRATNVAPGDSRVTIPSTSMTINAEAITRYTVWVSAVDYAGVTQNLNGSFRFLLDDNGATHVRAGDEAAFLATMATPGGPGVFYIHPDAALNTQLNLIGRNGDELHFLNGAQVTASVQSQGSWSDSRGTVNMVGCNDIRINGLRATNTFQFGSPASGDNQTSTVLNISRSKNIQIDGADIKSFGKSAVWIHGDSAVNMSDSTIDAYYFCVGVGASVVNFSNLTTTQFHPGNTGDRHSVFWVSSAMRAEVNNQLFRDTVITLSNTTMNLRTGRSIVSGNGGYESHTNLFFFGNTNIVATEYVLGKAIGWANFHNNYHGFTINATGNYPLPTRDLVQVNDDGELGRFIVNTYQGGGRPSELNPISFCEDSNCVTSDEVLGPGHPIDLAQGGLNNGWIPINPTQLSTTPSGDLQAAYSAAYEAVILNAEVAKIDMSGATRLRIRSRAQPQGTLTFRVSFANPENRLLNPEVFTVAGGNDWQTNTFQLPDSVRQTADKIIIGSFGNTQDATLEITEVSILAD